VPLSELVQKDKLVTVDANESVEKSFEVLHDNEFTCLPVREGGAVTSTFDYADLNAYLLVALGHIVPMNHDSDMQENVNRARSGRPVPVKFAAQLGVKDPFVSVPSSSTLSTAVEILGHGVHRIAVTDPSDMREVVGMLSQRRTINYIWEHGRLFKSLESLFQMQLSDLKIGSTKGLFTINGEDTVLQALKLMHNEGVSSLAVVDDKQNLLGNISIVDVRLLTKASQAGLLKHTCKQFLSVILSQRGLVDGKDSVPVFYVTMNTTLGRTIAKLTATKAHRLWIVQSSSPEDASMAAVPIPAPNGGGKLIGVVSLTDILNLLARNAGSTPDPSFARRERRRSSASSAGVRSPSSVESFRRSVSMERGLPEQSLPSSSPSKR
jgi:CBS domain-containing protein